MTISDPCQILQRVPELQDLIGDSKIRHAIESGDPFKIYRSLVLAKLFRRLPQHKDLLAMLTSQRRLFARGLKGTPALGTLNSVGFSFVGSDDRDTEGFYIALHAFVILFALPIVPLGSYLVQSTGEHQWRIFARVPLGIWGWLYTRGLAGAMVLLVLLGGGTSLHQASTQDLTILNGFSEPLSITHADQTTVVPAQGQTTINLKSGPQHIVASMARVGQVDVLNETIKPSGNTTFWNVAGATPLIMNEVVYYAGPNKPENMPPSKQQIYCGKRVIELDRIDYLFVDPPTSLKMNKHETTHTVTQLTVAKDAKLMGAEICTNWAFEQGEGKTISSAARTIAAMRNWNSAETGVALLTAWEQSSAAAISVLSAARKARPDLLDFERSYRDAMEVTGQVDALRKEYVERVRLKPQDPVAHYLLASITRGADGLKEMQDMLQRFPAYAPALASLSWRKVAHHDYAGAEADFKRLRTLAPQEATEFNETEMDALLGQHRVAEVKKLLQQALSDKKQEDQYPLATRMALVTRLAGGNSDDVLTSANFPEAPWLDLARLQVGLPALNTESARSNAAELIHALRDNPGKAIELASKKSQLNYLSSEYQYFLFSLAMRQKNQAIVNKMQLQLHISQQDRTLLQAYIDGAHADLDQGDLPPEVQIAATFFRSRNPQLPASEREQLRKLAFQTDLQPNLVRHALNNWPQ